jgi:hypothetical protein
MMTLDEFITRFDKPKRTPKGGYVCRCPAHDDKTASLSVSQSDTGKLLVNCFASCAVEEVLGRVGLKLSDLMPPKEERKAEKARIIGPVIEAYDYEDENGVLIYQVTRHHPKTFLQRRPHPVNGWEANLNGVVKVLYHLPALLAGIQRGDNVYLVEGEKDVHTLESWGLTATTNAGGAGAWGNNPRYIETLKDATRLYVLPDNDKAGRLWADKVRASLPHARVLWLPDLAEKGDVSDWATQGGTREKLEQLCATIDAAEAAVEPAAYNDGDRAEIRNYTGEKNEATALPVADVVEAMQDAVGDWPRRVDSLLFVEDGNGGVRWLESVDRLFSWMHSRARLCWKNNGLDADGASYLSRGVFYEHLQASATTHMAVESLPHEPPISNVYYTWRHGAGDATGSLFAGLLAFFDNAETPQDAALIRAMFLTPAWGGLPGCRPLFVIDAVDRGCGKSRLAQAVGDLYGGAIELEPEGAEDKVKGRLLTPSALRARVVRIDNVRRTQASSLIEGLITAGSISGHRLYCGEASRPNFLTWIITGNNMELSRDLAERAFIIRLTRPTPRPGWDDQLARYIEDNRAGILADIVESLRAEPAPHHVAYDRWMSFVDGVLARCGVDTAAIVEENQRRRAATDTDLEEAAQILDALISSASMQDNGTFFVSCSSAVSEIHRQMFVTWNAQTLSRKIKAHMDAGRLPDVEPHRYGQGRGYVIKGRRLREAA